jgi:pimeloyl-ACP methyl ester carboxylesterase
LLRGEAREFTDTEGRTVTAEVVRVINNEVHLRVRSKLYQWPLDKLSEEDQTFLHEWKLQFDAKRSERLATLVGRFPERPLTHRAYATPEAYLAGDVYEGYLKRIVPQYRADSLEALRYEISKQTAALLVPSNYDESAPFGVYVQVTAAKRGRLPLPEVSRVLQEHRLIFICPHGAGNTAPFGYRLGLALDALATAKAHYHIDPKRCFVGGVSGGGVSSTMIAYLRPEPFRGAINIVRGALLEPYTIEHSIRFFGGKQSYEAGQTYPPFLPHLSTLHPTLSRRYRDKRWAFISGEKDFNYEFTKASAPQWTKHGYQAKYFHVPGMGHTDAPAKTLDHVFAWMEK